MGAPPLTVSAVTKRYGETEALHAVSFQVEAGEVLTVVGPNGAGKTTLMHIIAGIHQPTEGEVRICGLDLHNPDEELEAKRLIGFMPDSDSLIDRVTPAEYLEFVGATYGLSPAEARRRAAKLLPILGFPEGFNRWLGQLSHGMRKRVQLAAALIHKPQILLFDEPTTALDPEIIVALKDLIRLLRQEGRAMLLATHDLTFAADLSDRICILQHGKLIASGPPAELRDRYGASTMDEVFMAAIGATGWREHLGQVLADL